MPVVTPTRQQPHGARWRRLAGGKTDLLAVQAIRYAVVGVVALVVDVTFLVLLTEFADIHYLSSAALSFTCGLMTNYGLSITWVFDHRSVENRWIEFGMFAAIGLIGLAMLEVIMWSLTEHAGFNYLISKAIATIVVFTWNFLARRYLLFQRREDSPSYLAHVEEH